MTEHPLPVSDPAPFDDLDERFRLIVENARDYAIFTTDERGLILSWPPGAEAVFGWRESEILGLPASVLFVEEDREGRVPEIEFGMAREHGRAPDVRWHQHKSGKRVFIEGSVWWLDGADGSQSGFLKIGQDMTLRRQNEIALMESEDRFRVLATTVPQLVFRSTAEGRRSWASPQWSDYTGMSAAHSQGYGWLEAIHPDDREDALGQWRDVEDGGQSYRALQRIRRQSDGMYRWHQTQAVPLGAANAEGAREWVGASTDVHDMRVMQERQDLLVGELQHRTRNLLAVVRSIAAQTAASVTSLDEFRIAFDNRLGALGRVQGLLSRTDGQSVTVERLLRIELAAVTADWHRIALDGSRIFVTDGVLQTLMLVVHELATNAVRHGGLSDPEGALAISWTVEGDPEDGGFLVIDWRERFSPRAVNPDRPSGFGRQMIEEAIPYQLGAQTQFKLTDTTLNCVLSLPLDGPSGTIAEP